MSDRKKWYFQTVQSVEIVEFSCQLILGQINFSWFRWSKTAILTFLAAIDIFKCDIAKDPNPKPPKLLECSFWPSKIQPKLISLWGTNLMYLVVLDWKNLAKYLATYLTPSHWIFRREEKISRFSTLCPFYENSVKSTISYMYVFQIGHLFFHEKFVKWPFLIIFHNDPFFVDFCTKWGLIWFHEIFY